MPFGPEDLKSAQQVFDAIVGGQASRARTLAPVAGWPTGAWSAFADTMRMAKFDFRNPRHLEALQYLIDKACVP